MNPAQKAASDQVALQLGNAIIQAIAAQAELQQAMNENQTLRARVAELEAKPD